MFLSFVYMIYLVNLVKNFLLNFLLIEIWCVSRLVISVLFNIEVIDIFLMFVYSLDLILFV